MSEEKQDKRVKIRINCGGFQGQPVSVFAAYDVESGVLAIVRETPYEVIDREGWLRVTTNDSDPHHDMVFSEDDTRAAIMDYFELEGMGMIRYSEGLARMNPTNKIERDGMDDNGMKYRIHPDIMNSHVAVLIACRAARNQRGVDAAQEMFEAFMSI